ncbi:MAG: PIN domain-containing protein [Prevotella sp.]|jgi:predicted nucleic acid-binding protein|nr:PIN domain-containing protein [Prevotella sp.]
MMRAYVDTNILVDLVLSRQEFLPDAQRVFAIGYAGEAQLVVSALSFVNTVYLGRKYKFPMDDVLSKLRMIADFVDVADLSGQNVVDMLNSGWRDYEDATQHRSAIDEQADCIVTRNKKDFKASTLPVLTPLEFFNRIDSK